MVPPTAEVGLISPPFGNLFPVKDRQREAGRDFQSAKVLQKYILQMAKLLVFFRGELENFPPIAINEREWGQIGRNYGGAK